MHLANYSTQTVIRLSLHLNQIGSQGAAYLANTLRENQVTIHLIYLLTPRSLCIDAH